MTAEGVNVHGKRVARFPLRGYDRAGGRVSLFWADSEPFVDRGDMHGGGRVAHGHPVVPSCRRVVTLEPVDAAFHGVLLCVVLGVEGRWTAALRPLGPAMRVLVDLTRDGRLDPTTAKTLPV
ncbi:hypothetical protein GCM10010428_40690 [Actinosynnema pretiosum subsp. pretiosum]